MLSPSAPASPRYYLNLASTHGYYEEGGEAPGIWYGSLAPELELAGRVRRHDLLALFDGDHPQTGKPVVQKHDYADGKRPRKPSTDLVTSHDKSFDVMWALGDRKQQEQFEAAHSAANAAVIDYLEKNAAFSRVGKDGDFVRAKLAIAAFTHTTNRECEAFLHSHLVVLNVGLNQDGKTRAIENKFFYEHQMAAGAIYRLRHSNEVAERLGLELKAEKGRVRVKEVPKEVCDFFSTRKRQIEEALKQSRVAGPAAADAAARETRKTKRHIPLAELTETWRGQAKELGFDRKLASRLYGRFTLNPFMTHTPERCVADAIKTVEKTRSVFTAADVIRHSADNALGKGISDVAILDEVDKTLSDQSRVVTLAEERGTRLYTTRELVTLEESTIELARSSASSRSHAVQPQQIFQAVKAVTAKLVVDGRTDPEFVLTHETRNAIAHITRDTGRVACIDAPHGTDKVTVLEAATHAWELRKLNVIGVAATREGSMGLELSTGIKSHTLGSLLYRIDPTPIDQARHHARQLLRAARSKETSHLNEVPKEPLLKHDGKAVYEANKHKRLTKNKKLQKILPELQAFQSEKVRISSSSVLVIDDANSIGTRDMHRLLSVCKRLDAKVVLIGDTGTQQSYSAGAAYRQVRDELGNAAKLTENQRQVNSWERRALDQLREGRVESGLSEYVSRGRVHVASTGVEAKKELVHRWASRQTEPSKTVIVVSTKAEEVEVNRLAQEAQQLRGKVRTGRRVKIQNGVAHVGDRVRLSSGLFATVKRISRNPLHPQLTLQVEGREVRKGIFSKPMRITVDVWQKKVSKGIKLAYACQLHDFQGAAPDRAFVLGNYQMQDRQHALASLSLASKRTDIYLTEAAAGEELAEAAKYVRYEKSIKRSRPKQLAHDRLEQDSSHQAQRQQQEISR